MKKKFAVSVAGVAAGFASLILAGSSRADTYTETLDAGDLPSSAQTVLGTAGTPLTSLLGGLTLTNGISDSDMYEIYIASPSTFSASLTAFIPGRNNFDSQLAIFTLAGLGVVANDDDAASGAQQSNLTAGSTQLSSLPAGLYYLLISGSGRYPVSGSGLIFPNFTDGVTDQTATVGPTGPGGASVVNGFSGSSNEGGFYTIALTGAQFVTAVPEPSTYALLFTGLMGTGLLLRSRRQGKTLQPGQP